MAKWGEGKEAATAGLEIANQSPIQYLQSLIAHIGAKLVKSQQRGQKRQYSYKPEGGSLPDDFNELYAAVSAKTLQKWEEKVQKKESEKRSAITPETLDETSLDSVTPLTNISYSNVAMGGTETEENLESATPPQTVQGTGWARRFGEWVRACYIGPTDGKQVRIQIWKNSGWSDVLAWPENLRWDEVRC